MKKHFSLVVLAVLLTVGGWLLSATSSNAAATVLEQQRQDIAGQIIAREKAAVEAWQRKDKAFWSDYLADEATYFGPHSPYLEVEPKVNMLPKFEQHVEQFKFTDVQMYNPRVQVYGDVAILTYNSAVTANFGGRPVNYTGKMSVVYARQGGTWRVVHGHESMNPGAH